MREAWAQGANYDRSLLTFHTAESGFILGEGILGQTPLGPDGPDVLLDADFTTCVISSPVTVEDGLFVSREVETCTLTATLPAQLDLEGKRLTIRYDGIRVFKGTVSDAEWSESVDVGRQYLPGNTATKTYRVSLTAASGEEAFAQSATPPKNFNNVTAAARLASWLGATAVTSIVPAADLDGPLLDNTRAAVSDRRLQYASDSTSGLLDEIRDQLQLTNLHYRYEPWDSSVEVITNSRWLAGTSEATALRFTDNPASDTQTGGDPFIHNDRTVSYTQRIEGSDRSMFVKGVKVSVTDSAEVTTEYGPFRATGAFPNDVAINLGRNSLAGPELVRAWVATLPLRKKSERFTRRLRLPLQSRKQIGVAGPGMALLEADGDTKPVAVLSVQHSITPTQWLVEYDCGPAHLITRESDLDPYVVRDLTATQTVFGPPGVTFEWTTPKLPGGQHTWAIVDVTPADLPLTSWSIPSGSFGQIAKPEGTPEIIFVAGDGIDVGTHTFALFYTSDPLPGFSAMDLAYTQGQPAFVTITLT